MGRWLKHFCIVGFYIAYAASSSACSFVGDDPNPVPNLETIPLPPSIREGDLNPENPRIDVIMHGGWGQYDNFSVTPDGEFIQRFTYGIPEVAYQLSELELDSLYQFFSGFRGFEVRYHTGCADGDIYDITVKNKFFEHTVTADCVYEHPNLIEESVEWQLDLLIGELLRLSQKTLQQSAPWIGVTGVPSLDRDSYSFRDSVQVRYELFNPTSIDRTVFLIAEDVFNIRVTGRNTSSSLGWDSVFCPRIPDDLCVANPISIVPGARSLITNTFSISDLLSAPPPSNTAFTASFWLLTVEDLFPPGKITFQVSP